MNERQFNCVSLQDFWRLTIQDLRDAIKITVAGLVVKDRDSVVSSLGGKVFTTYYRKSPDDMSAWAVYELEGMKRYLEPTAEDACRKAGSLLQHHASTHPHPDVYLFHRDGEPRALVHRVPLEWALDGS